MTDLKPIFDIVKNLTGKTEWPNSLIHDLCQEIAYLRHNIKGCCCTDGASNTSMPATKGYEENPFPVFGEQPCKKCNGLNILTKLNCRQRETIERLYGELEQAIEEREKIAEILTRKK